MLAMTDQDSFDQSAATTASDAARQVKHDLDNVAAGARTAAGDIKDEAVQQAEALKDAAQTELGDVADKAKSFAADQKDEAAGRLDNISGAVSRIADELGKDDDTAMVATYARDLAGGIQRVSASVKNNSVDDLVAMAEDFGRRQPVAFLGAAALAGFVASRFLIASGQRRTSAATDTRTAPDTTGQPYSSTEGR
jgi:hypothetical protein